jgi:hypothetical protein
MSKKDVVAAGHWQGFRHVPGCGFVVGHLPSFVGGVGSVTTKICLPCMLYALAGKFYGARDILKFDSLGGELSADLGKTAVIRPVNMKRRLDGDGLTPASVGAFEKTVCKRVNVLRRELGKAPRIEHLEAFHGGRWGAAKNAVTVAGQDGRPVDYAAVCKDLRWKNVKQLLYCTHPDRGV